MRISITFKQIILIAAIVLLFVPIAVFSPGQVTDYLVRVFDLHAPVLPPRRQATGQWALAEKVKAVITDSDIRDRIGQLTSGASRVVGYPGHEAAADYIHSEFLRIGLDRVAVEDYDVASPIDKGCSLQVVGESGSVPLYAVWPNLVRTSTLPRQGMRIQLVDGGNGEFEAYNGQPVDGCAVLMGFNSWNRWMNASMLGAKAVIFIEPDSTTTAEAEQKFFQVPLNVPRFWISKAEGMALRERLKTGGKLEVLLKARMDWEKHKTRNIVGWIEGKDPELKKETILFDHIALQGGEDIEEAGLSDEFQVSSALPISYVIHPKGHIAWLRKGSIDLALLNRLFAQTK